MSALSCLGRSYHNNHQSTALDQGWCPHSSGARIPYLNEAGYLVDPQRQLIHPKFRQVRDEGVFYYDFNPDITRNFIYAPGLKVDGAVQATIDSNILIQTPQVDEDVIITEIWSGSSNKLSTLASMFRVFYDYWTTLPDPGTSISWWPADITTDRYDVQIVRVQLGSSDYEYKEIPVEAGQSTGAYLDKQLTLQMKITKTAPIPKNSLTLEGI